MYKTVVSLISKEIYKGLKLFFLKSVVFLQALSKYLVIILVVSVITSKDIRSSQNIATIETFTIEILGCSNWIDFIPGPCPPGVSQCGYDTQGYDEMNFNLTYFGSFSINISQISVWQKLRFIGISWNHSAYYPIPVPNVSLKTGDSYYYTVRDIYTFYDAVNLYPHGPFYTQIMDDKNNTFWVRTVAPDDITVFNNTELLENTHLYPAIRSTPVLEFPYFSFWMN